jgi:FAD/FMN-containing dehydrogenase
MQQEAIVQPGARFRGEPIEPADARYEEARKVYNAAISRKPRLIARCADEADVMAAVQLAGEQDLRVSIRCGGNYGSGGSYVDCIRPAVLLGGSEKSSSE